MKSTMVVMVLVAVMAALIAPVQGGVLVAVTATGEVEYNLVSEPSLGDVIPGDKAKMTFVVDSDVFMDSSFFPTRGYDIDLSTFSLAFNGTVLGLQDPFPAGETPYFVIRDNDPAVDGFFVSTNVDLPMGVPISQVGIFDQFRNNYLVTYTGDTLPSLDILNVLGIYDYSGLTVFNWTVDDGPFNSLGVIFEQMTIEPLILDDDGDGISNSDDLCPETVIPESVPMVRLGINRWAIVDDDGIFDTNLPHGQGTGFAFDLQDTAGCACEQIIDEMGLGKGHERFGCSNSAMIEWASYASGAAYDLPDTAQFVVPSLNDRLTPE